MVISFPSKTTEPSFAERSPVRVCSVVVFPAPLAPIRAMTSPWFTSKEIPFKKQSVIHRDCAINGAFIPILNTKNYLLVGMDNNYNTTIGKYFYQIFNVNQLLSN